MVRRLLTAAAAALVAAGLAVAPAAADGRGSRGPDPVRFATFNASLNRPTEGGLAADLADGEDPQAQSVARILRAMDADVVLLNEVDHDPAALAHLREKFLAPEGVDYPYVLAEPVNTGVPSGHDLDNDGTVGGPGDALGFGDFPGQYGMVLLSRFPIDADAVRTFQNLRWADMPGALLPEDPTTGEAWYTDAELDALPLSSKSHWDVPIRVGRTTVHVLAAHPTPPSFDGPEERNARRNHDEIRLWADYVTGGRTARWIVDDDGERGGLRPGARFVVLGDLNADPLDGDSWPGAIDQLLEHRRVRDPEPTSEGAVEAAATQGGANATHRGDPGLDTADFTEPAPGNLRVDYVLPARNLRTTDAEVFWPLASDPASALTFDTSDHHPVWADVRVPGRR